MNVIILQNNKLYINNIMICNYIHPGVLKPGFYNIEINYSPKFKTKLPLVYNVDFPPSRGFRIHQGNTLKDSKGCILVGNMDKPEHLVDSKNILNMLISMIINNNISNMIIME